jgi:hypothetical protein
MSKLVPSVVEQRVLTTHGCVLVVKFIAYLRSQPHAMNVKRFSVGTVSIGVRDATKPFARNIM